MQFKPFCCNIHAHSDNSLDGGSSVKNIVHRAKELGYKRVVLTEHGNMNSAASLAMEAEEAGLKYTHGVEAYLEPPKLVTSSDEKDQRSYYHITILFKTLRAYEYFCKLTPIMESRAVVRFGERKPLIKWEEIEEIGSDLVIGSGCLVGMIQKAVMKGDLEAAERAYTACRSLVQPGCFFVELFPHCVTHEWKKPLYSPEGRLLQSGQFVANECLPGEQTPNDLQKKPNLFVLEMAKKYGDKVVVSEDSHFAYPEQKLVQDAKLGNGNENWRFYNSYHMRPTEEIFKELNHSLGISSKQMEEFIDNSYALDDVLSSYQFLSSKDRWVLPTFDGDTKRHLMKLIKKHGRMINTPEYIERLKKEVAILADNGKADFLPYVFEVEDISSWCKENSVLMNLRGSAGGSLIFYLIGASITDPIRYDLPVERFITVDRILANAIPDADSDLSDKAKTIAYAKSKYGDRILPLSTNTNLKLKNSIKDVERAIFGEVRKSTDTMCHSFPTIPQGPTEEQWLFGYTDKETGLHVEGFWEKSKVLRDYAEQNPDVWKMVEECLGVMRNKSRHACGFLVTPAPVHHHFPVTWVGSKKDGQLCVAFDPKTLEWAGGIKFDWLRVKTLEVIRIATDLIKQRHNVDIPWREYDHDIAVYENIFHTGNTAGVFQYNTNVIKPFLKSTKPTSTQHLAALTALGRPGTLDAPAPDGSDRTCAQYYVDVIKGEQCYYIHDDMKQIVSETHGIMLYQEQTLKVFTILGGYTLGMAEDVRRAISKKKRALMELHLGKLKTTLLSRGWNESQANTLVAQIIASSNYSFNKAHAMSYAIVGYATAYLKYKYPLEFWTAELTVFSDGDHKDKLKGYFHTLSSILMPPSISKSHASQWLIEGDKIRAPLCLVAGIGDATSQEVTKYAPYSSVEDFADRCSGRAVNRGTFTNLVLSGLFDEYNLSYPEMIERYWKRKKIKVAQPEMPHPTSLAMFLEKVKRNQMSSGSLIDFARAPLLKSGWVAVPNSKRVPFLSPVGKLGLLADVDAAVKFIELQKDVEVYMIGLFDGSAVTNTKNGYTLLKVSLHDGHQEFEAVSFRNLTPLRFPKNTLVLIKGKIKKGYKTPVSMMFSSIETLTEV
jgi:DNA polymerase III subunit alpha